MHDVKDLAAIVARLNIHFPRSGGMTNEQIVSIAEDWAEDLEDFPLPVIRRAAKLCRMDEGRRFFPTTGEFIGYCRNANVEYRRFVHRQLPPPPETGDEDERKRKNGIRRMDELYSRMKWRRDVI